MVLFLVSPSSPMVEAAKHYKYFLDNGFKKEYSLKIIGDKYTLNKYNRLVLYRCIHPSIHISDVMSKVVYYNMDNKILCVDFYNVLITIYNIVIGNILYLGNDKFLRDMSGMHGRLKDKESLTYPLHLFINYISSLPIKKVIIYLESQVSKSGEYASMIREYLKDKGEVYLHKNVDTVLSSCKGIVATSDSVIHLKASKIIDIPRSIAEHSDFTVEAIDFSYII